MLGRREARAGAAHASTRGEQKAVGRASGGENVQEMRSTVPEMCAWQKKVRVFEEVEATGQEGEEASLPRGE